MMYCQLGILILLTLQVLSTELSTAHSCQVECYQIPWNFMESGLLNGDG